MYSNYEVIKKKKDSLLAILGSFLYDPLISFRLMIPMIIRKRKIMDLIKSGNKKLDEEEIKNKFLKKIKRNDRYQMEEENFFDIKENNFNNFECHSMKNNFEKSFKKINKLLKSLEENRNKLLLKDSIIGEKKISELKAEDLLKNEEEEEKEKEEKKKMEDDERLIFNLFEENDEIESEELNKIAQMVLDRIKDKLSGKDIHPDFIYDSQTQVDKLIAQATSFENLAQSYLGWCPFW